MIIPKKFQLLVMRIINATEYIDKKKKNTRIMKYKIYIKYQNIIDSKSHT
jgi:hypothetical protein